MAKTTAGIYKISQSDLEAFAIPLVPIEEQELIRMLLGESLRSVNEVESDLASMKSSLTASWPTDRGTIQAGAQNLTENLHASD